MSEQVKSLSPFEQIRSDMNKMSSQLKAVLPPNVTPEKFIRVTLTALQNSPDLIECDRQSLFSAVMKCAQDGLLPDGREAALTKFNSKQGPKAQYMPMVGGILKKVRNSGELSTITAQIVHKNDKFRYWVDSNGGEQLEHEPLVFGERGDPIGVYALAKTKDGSIYIEPMTVDQIMAVRSISKAKDFGPWAGPFASEMWRKTAIRRLSKRLPMSTDVEEIIRHDDEMYDFKQIEGPKNKTEELTKKLELEVLSEEEAGVEV